MKLTCVDKTLTEYYENSDQVSVGRVVKFAFYGRFPSFRRSGDFVMRRISFGLFGSLPYPEPPEHYSLENLNETDFNYYKVGQDYTLALIQEAKG
jgi:hypothetical protein